MIKKIDNTLVSIIMPSYNVEKLIGQSIESVIAQSYKDWELIIIDDCSVDATCRVVEKYAKLDARIRLFVLGKNNGAPAAPRNIGVREARGDWVAMLDSDDIWHPMKLEFQMKYLSKTGAKFCSTQMNDFNDFNEIEILRPRDIRVERITFSKQLRRYRTPTSSVILSKELLVSNPFNEDLRFKAREDLDCWLRIHEHIGSSIKLLFPFLNYRHVEGQISGSKLSMVKRTLFVLGEYRQLSGKFLGWRKYIYVSTHVIYSIYYRIIKKSL